MFLSEDDYRTVCDEFELEHIQNNPAVRQSAERSAMEQISSYLINRYDMALAFAARGEERNPMLVQCAINIALYILVHHLPHQMGADRRDELYEESLRWLKDVQTSKASPNLPKYTDGNNTDAHNPIAFGCAIEKHTHTW